SWGSVRAWTSPPRPASPYTESNPHITGHKYRQLADVSPCAPDEPDCSDSSPGRQTRGEVVRDASRGGGRTHRGYLPVRPRSRHHRPDRRVPGAVLPRGCGVG